MPEKKTIFEQAIPYPDNHKRAHIAPRVDLLVTLYILTPVGKNCNHALLSTASTPSFSMPVYGINRRALRFRLSLFAKKSMRRWSHCNVCVCVCVFFSQMRKINAGGKRETSKKHAQALHLKTHKQQLFCCNQKEQDYYEQD